MLYSYQAGMAGNSLGLMSDSRMVVQNLTRIM